jgi:hypothetical protein
MTDRASTRRVAAARRQLGQLQRWQAVEHELEVEALALAEQARALAWQLDRATRRVGAGEVTDPELQAHLDAATALGATRRQELLNTAQRRVARKRVRTLTAWLGATEAAWLRDPLR